MSVQTFLSAKDNLGFTCLPNLERLLNLDFVGSDLRGVYKLSHTFISFVYHGQCEAFLFVMKYRVTIPFVQNLPLTSKQKLCFGLARPGQARSKWNFCFDVNGRF